MTSKLIDYKSKKFSDGVTRSTMLREVSKAEGSLSLKDICFAACDNTKEMTDLGIYKVV